MAMDTLVTDAPEGELSNLRDFGGLRTADGGEIVRRRLFRSEHTHGLSTHGRARLRALGICTVIDVRGSKERSAYLPVEIPGVVVHSTPVEPRTGPRLATMRQQGTLTRAAVHQVMVNSYREYVREASSQFGAAIARIVQAGNRPLLLHCTAGKDRTGFTVAVIQAALGVDRDEIIRHYLLTNELLHRKRLVGHVDAEGDAMEPVLVAHPDYLEAAFHEIQARHGGVDAFLAAATQGAVDARTLEMFRDPSPPERATARTISPTRMETR